MYDQQQQRQKFMKSHDHLPQKECHTILISTIGHSQLVLFKKLISKWDYFPDLSMLN
uniref:Uncharacterized protein n=1 Tax=Arion vulgaris TaxID=1028688 RepID=A0A0B6ZIQ1_9EUPU